MSEAITTLVQFEGMFSIVAYWAGLVAIFTGLGLGIRRLFRAQSLDLDQCIVCFWIGFAATVCFLQIWHLFFAITWRPLAILVLGGAVSLGWNVSPLVGLVRTLKRRQIVLGIVCSLLVSLWVANQAAGPPTEWDSLSYHLPTVRWYMRYPVVLGLGNLHDRLAFNSSSLLYAAMLECGPWAGRASHVANGLLVLLFLLQILLSLVRVIRYASGNRAPFVFDVILVTPIIAIAVSDGISSFTTDVAPAIVVFVVCSLLYRLLSRNTADLAAGYDVGVIISLAILAICLKASMIVIAPVLIVVAFVYLFRAAVPRPAIALAAKWCLVFSVLLVVPWMVHGILLSGYPVFPSTLGGVKRDWTVPQELAAAEHWYIIASNRRSAEVGLAWIPGWYKHDMTWLYRYRAQQLEFGRLGVQAPLALTVAAILFGLILAIRKRRTQGDEWSLFFACATGAVFWFWTSPSPRFGFPILWSLAAVAVAQAASLHSRQARRLALPFALAMTFAPILLPLPPRSFVQTLVNRAIIRPGPDHGLYPYPKAELQRFTTQSGLVLFVPVHDERCFDAPLPCTPTPAPNVVLSVEPGGRPKFVTKGSWQQLNWPNVPYHEFWKRFGPRPTTQADLWMPYAF